MSEIADFEAFHPRAVRLMRKRKNFVVVAEDEPYFMQVYRLIRKNERANGTWSDEDERIYQSAQQSVQSDECPVCHRPMERVETDKATWQYCQRCGIRRSSRAPFGVYL